MASVPLRCELVARKNHLAWKWAVTASLLIGDGVEIAEMAAGRDFAVYLTSSGKLLQCGMTPRPIPYDKFRLHRDKRRSRAHAVGAQLKRLSARERERQSGHACDLKCCPLEIPMMEKIRVRQVACGATHCVALGDVCAVAGVKLGLFAWGLGEYGQLGLGDCQSASKMTPVTASPELLTLLQSTVENHSVMLRCGAFSTYLLSRGTSILWHWGLLPPANHDSHFVRQGVPVKFPLLDENTRLVDVVAGVEHVVFLSEDGCVFTWGYGSSGQLGLGPSITSNVDCEHPTQVDFFCQETNHCIAAVSCGWHHTVAVAKSGQVYAWGSNASGACGAKSKFCEYFQPVLVAVPCPVELGLTSADLHTQVRCGANSSSLLFFRCGNDNYLTIERAFIWGVGSTGIGTLVPLEVFSYGVKQSRFVNCCMKSESSMWLLHAGTVSSAQEVSPAWIVTRIDGFEESRQEFEKGLPCLHVGVGAQICVQVQAITKAASDVIANLSNDDNGKANLFELQQQDPLSNSSEKDCTCVSIFSVTRKTQGDEVEMNSTVQISILAQAKERSIISLSNSTGAIIGNKFVVDIVPQNECEATTIDERGNQDNSICILGVRVERDVTESQERVDKNWYKLHSKRIRVHTDDAVVVLIKSRTNDLDPAVQVEFRDNQWQYGLIHLDVAGVDDKARDQKLGVVQLRFPSPGRYFIYDVQTREIEHDHHTPLLVVHCCMNSRERKRVLTEYHDFVWSKYQSALMEAPLPAQFSFFLSSILRHSALRDCVVCSPWTTTYDEECCEPSFDFDREYEAKHMLVHHPEHPFILWDPYFPSSSTLVSVQQQSRDADSLSLSAILPTWAQPLSLKLAFRIATWLEKPNTGSAECLEDLPIDYNEAHLKVAATGLSVQQIPFDFLGSISLMYQRAVRDALVPVNPNIMGVHDSIVSWKRTNGDLFYTVQSNDLFVRRYGHESHDFPETAQCCRITRLKSQLSGFLWQATEGKKIEDLFYLLTSATNQRLLVTENCSLHNNSTVDNTIHLRELISHTTTLGFDKVVAVPKQEWFALFRGIQALSPPNSTGIAFSTFRTFLVDPFHQFFWKQYVHQVRELANSSHEMIIRALVESFEVNERIPGGMYGNNNDLDCSINSSDDEEVIVPWSDFVVSLRSFHNILGRKPLPRSDCCRLLYRFDTQGNGLISTRSYQKSLLHTLDEIDAATQGYDFMNVRKAQPNKKPKGKQSLKVAIANGHRRPNVELFTSSEAVHKLFAARAKTCKSSKSLSRTPSNDTVQSTCTATSRANDAAAAFRVSANTHLARIRNLPISRLLREGIYFRPPRKTMYPCEDERDSTQAQTMGAEDSY